MYGRGKSSPYASLPGDKIFSDEANDFPGGGIAPSPPG